MKGLFWVTVVFFLSVENTSAAVDQKWLTDIVQTIKNKYQLGDTSSWAVNIPQNQDPSHLMEVLQEDPPDAVKIAVSKSDVYQGKRMTVSTQSVAIPHVLEKIKVSQTGNQGNTIIIYSEKYQNINENGIAANINKIIHSWGRYAFVFSKVVDVADAGIPARAELFKQQELSKFGLENIFRCYEPGGSFQCTSCGSVENVAPSCLVNTPPSNDVTELEKRRFKEARGGGRKRRGGRRRKGGEVKGGGRRRKGGKVKGGGRRRKGGKVKGGGRRRKGGKVQGGGRRRKGGKVKGGGRRRKGGKVKGGGRRRKGGKVKGGGRRRKGGKVKGGGRRRKGGKVKGGGRRRKGGEVKRGGRRRKGGEVKGGGGRHSGGNVGTVRTCKMRKKVGGGSSI
ncbi:uncharacterized protein LOC111608597 isoform X1 [Xiphophorus maculatus]|uniref:uncharacterized protein LOC111608597 isoform X1 n=1 Tax=Xiphophorus maculatus TaxID=8083 RepID=UPI000C6E8C00|nr:uncharacterized protein LOC111608597 isoform X1 [Xiphophorus maculatus]